MTTVPTVPTVPTVKLPPINGRTIEVGMVSERYLIGSNRRGKQNVPVYDDRVVEYIAEMAKKRVYKKFDCRILITGAVRTGKSTLACKIARKLCPDFTPEHVCFRLQDFTDVLSKLSPADPERGYFPTAILDESGVDLYSKEWQTVLVKRMAKIYQVIGKKNLTMIMCLPHRNLLTRDIREQLHIWVVTRTTPDGDRGFAELREGVDNIWNMELFWKPLCAFTFDGLDDDFWAEYEARKDVFIDKFVSEPLPVPQNPLPNANAIEDDFENLPIELPIELPDGADVHTYKGVSAPQPPPPRRPSRGRPPKTA